MGLVDKIGEFISESIAKHEEKKRRGGGNSGGTGKDGGGVGSALEVEVMGGSVGVTEEELQRDAQMLMAQALQMLNHHQFAGLDALTYSDREGPATATDGEAAAAAEAAGGEGGGVPNTSFSMGIMSVVTVLAGFLDNAVHVSVLESQVRRVLWFLGMKMGPSSSGLKLDEGENFAMPTNLADKTHELKADVDTLRNDMHVFEGAIKEMVTQIEHGTDTKEALEQLQGSITEARSKVFEVKKGLDSKAGFKDLQAHLDMVSEQLKVSSSKNPQVSLSPTPSRSWSRS